MSAGDCGDNLEIMEPFQALQMAGHTVHSVYPYKNKGDYFPTAVHDVVGDLTCKELNGHNVMLNYSFDDINDESNDGLMIYGRKAPEYLRLTATSLI